MDEPRDCKDPAWRLAMENEGLAHMVACREYERRGELRRFGTLDDVVQEAVVLLHRAARNYDPGRGGRFSTYACKSIRCGLLNVPAAGALVKIPHSSFWLAVRGGTAAGRTCLRPGTVRQALAALDGVGSLSVLHERGRGCRPPRDDRPDFEGLRLALARLPAEDRDLVGRLFGLNGRPAEDGEEAAARLGVTRQEVNRRLDKARGRLRGYMTGTFWDWDEEG